MGPASTSNLLTFVMDVNTATSKSMVEPKNGGIYEIPVVLVGFLLVPAGWSRCGGFVIGVVAKRLYGEGEWKREGTRVEVWQSEVGEIRGNEWRVIGTLANSTFKS